MDKSQEPGLSVYFPTYVGKLYSLMKESRLCTNNLSRIIPQSATQAQTRNRWITDKRHYQLKKATAVWVALVTLFSLLLSLWLTCMMFSSIAPGLIVVEIAVSPSWPYRPKCPCTRKSIPFLGIVAITFLGGVTKLLTETFPCIRLCSTHGQTTSRSNYKHRHTYRSHNLLFRGP